MHGIALNTMRETSGAGVFPSNRISARRKKCRHAYVALIVLEIQRQKNINDNPTFERTDGIQVGFNTSEWLLQSI